MKNNFKKFPEISWQIPPLSSIIRCHCVKAYRKLKSFTLPKNSVCRTHGGQSLSRRCNSYAENLSTEKASEKEGAWLQKENENRWRQKRPEEKTRQGQKKTDLLMKNSREKFLRRIFSIKPPMTLWSSANRLFLCHRGFSLWSRPPSAMTAKENNREAYDNEIYSHSRKPFVSKGIS